MGISDIQNMGPEEFRQYAATHNEADYTLVDVRERPEYAAHHIPGAKLMPLSEFEGRLAELPEAGDVVFYCASGNRSRAAAILFSDAGDGTVYNLLGGIYGWEGRTLSDFPKVRVFDGKAELVDLLVTAMNLEKGAQKFYEHLLNSDEFAAFAETAENLAKAEVAHAKSIYGFWKNFQTDPQPFDRLYDVLSGDILEGGSRLADMVAMSETLTGNPCIGAVDLALQIEYSAFDLYRNMADRSSDATAKAAFLSIAQAEKGHIRALAGALSNCSGE